MSSLRLAATLVCLAVLSSAAFAQSPTIQSMTYNPVAISAREYLSGTSFGTTQGMVLLNGTSVAVFSWSNSSISFNVPAGTALGNGTVQVVTAGGVQSNSKSLTVVQATAVTGISPTSGLAGSQVTITGSSFGASPGSIIYFGGSANFIPPLVSWADTQVVVTIPATEPVESGYMQLSASAYGLTANTPTFTIVGPPTIQSMTYNPVPIGAREYLSGTSFGTTQGTVLLNGTSVAVFSWSNSTISFNIPAGSTLGNGTVQVVAAGGVQSNSKSLTVVPATAVSGISPTSGLAGSQVTITGSSFGASPGSIIYFGGSANFIPPIVSWADTQVVVTIPATEPVESGYMQLSAYGLTLNTPTFTIVGPPTITSAFSNPDAAGSSDCLNGTSFGNTAGTVTLNGVATSTFNWGASTLCFNIPSTEALGTTAVQVTTAGGARSNVFNITVVAPPVVTGISPTNGPAGSQVTITGSSFGAASGGITYFGVNANFVPVIASWADTQVVVTIPSTEPAESGYMQLSAYGLTANTPTFTITPPGPRISTVTPMSGPVGTPITITGSRFGASQASGTVAIGNTNALIVSWSDTQIAAVVASGTSTGNVVVQQGGTSSNGINFTVNTGPLLQLSVSDTPLQVNLTSPQNLDWIHWGRISATLPDRKATATPLISDYTPVGRVPSLPGFGFIYFNWSDGQQDASLSDVSSDLESSGPGTGFQISVPADTSVKTLNLYLEVFNGQGLLQASLSDGSAASVTDQSVTDSDTASKVYSIDFRAASPGQTLTVTFSPVSGSVGLQAATLTPHLPVAAVISPTAAQSFAASGTVPVNAIAWQIDSSISDLKSVNSDGTVFDISTPPLNVNWNPTSAGHYSITATATDSSGLTNSTSPVEFDVIGQGGTLSIEEDPVPASPINLDTQGAADWILWGPVNTGDTIINTPGLILARKSAVAPLISDYKEIGNHPISPQVFAHNVCFTGDQQSYCSGSEISVHGLGNGFEIKVEADTNPRTLELYVGITSGDGHVTAFLSDGSAPVASEIGGSGPPPPPPGITTLYTINYSAASAGQILTVRFTLNSDQGGGQVSLIGAALSGLSVAPSVPAPQLDSITPNKAAVNTQVTLAGSNFGATQGSGTVLFGQTPAQAVNWNDGSITVLVPDLSDGNTALVAVSTDHGISNSVDFTVPSYRFFPPSLVLVVGQSATVQVKDSGGTIVNGLSWVAKDPTIVAVNNEDPPLLTGIAAGTTTVYAGDVPLPVTVYPGGSLPSGTPIWSVSLTPGATSATVIPAVPSADSNIDVFALDNAGYLSAVSGDGEVIWKRYIGVLEATVIPDFSGNAFIGQPASYITNDPSFNVPVLHTTHSINKMDPATGQLTPLYTYAGQFSSANGFISGGTQFDNGFVFTDGPETQAVPSPTGVLFIQDAPKVVVLDPATVSTLATISIDSSTISCETGTFVRDSISGPMIVAGDGNAYVPYVVTNETDQGCGASFISTVHVDTSLNILRVSPDGSSAKIPINQFTYDANLTPGNSSASGSYLVPYLSYFQPFPQGAFLLTVITNANQGIAMASPPTSDCQTPCQHTIMTLAANDAVTSQQDVALKSFTPVLQRSDGTYIGTDAVATRVDAVASNGSLVWQQTFSPAQNFPISITPEYLSADGTTTVTSTKGDQLGTVFNLDPQGNVASQSADTGAATTWKGAWYGGTGGTLTKYFFPAIDWMSSWWPVAQANPSEIPVSHFFGHEVAVIGWINKDLVPFPPADAVSSDLINSLNNSAGCALTLFKWSLGSRIAIHTDADRQYANAFLLASSANQPPPQQLDKSDSVLKGGDFRLYNTFQPAIATSDGKSIIRAVSTKSQALAGVTPDACGSALIGQGVTLSGLNKGEEHPDNGQSGTTTSRLHFFQLNEGRIGKEGQAVNMTLNACTSQNPLTGLCDADPSAATPYVWDYPLFDALGNFTVSQQIFPTYSIYVDRKLMQTIPQHPAEEFIQKNAASSQVKASDIRANDQ